MTDIIIRVPKSAISAAFNQGITTASELVRIAAIRKPEHKHFLPPPGGVHRTIHHPH